jgi:hypothetical protein
MNKLVAIESPSSHGNRDQTLLPGEAKHEQIGRDRIAKQRRRQSCRFDRIGGLGADHLADDVDQLAAPDPEVRIMGKVAGDCGVGVDDDPGYARLHLRQHLAAGGDDEITTEDQVGLAGGDADGIKILGLARDTDMRRHRAALLRQPGLVEDADALALDMGRHAEQRTDGHHAGAADAGDDDAVGPIAQRRQLRCGQGGLGHVAGRPPFA